MISTTHDFPVSCVAIADNVVVSGSHDETVKVYRIHTSEESEAADTIKLGSKELARPVDVSAGKGESYVGRKEGLSPARKLGASTVDINSASEAKSGKQRASTASETDPCNGFGVEDSDNPGSCRCDANHVGRRCTFESNKLSRALASENLVDRVLPLLLAENIDDIETLHATDVNTLRSIGLKLGDAIRVRRLS